MKLFVDGHYFDGSGQGTKSYLEGLYSSLVDQRKDIEFSMAAVDTLNLKDAFGVRPNLNYLKFKSGNKFFRLAVDIPSILKREKIDAAHFTYISPLYKTCSEIVTIHDILFRDFPQYFPRSYRLSKDFLFKRSAQRADWVVTISDFSKEALVRHYKINPDKIIITPIAVLDFFNVDSPALEVRNFPKKPFILYVSRFEPRKNQHGLLQAYVDLQLWRKNIQIVFVGTPGVDSPLFNKLYESLSNEIKNNVLFYSGISLPELKEFYKRCILHVYPSFGEGFGIPPLEAGVSGANSICSNTTAMSEFSFFGDRLFDPNKKDELRDKIAYYLDHAPNEAERKSIASAINEKYNWNKIASIFSEGVLRG